MTTTTIDQVDLEQSLARLQVHAESIPSKQRRLLAQTVQEEIERNGLTYVTRRLVFQLSEDPNSDVRKTVAGTLRLLLDKDLEQLGTKLAQDSNHFVAVKAQRALDQRHQEQDRVIKHRKRLEKTRRKLKRIGKNDDDNLIEAVQQLVEHEHDVFVGKLVHDLRRFMATIDTRVSLLVSKIEQHQVDPLEFRRTLEEISERMTNIGQLTEDVEAFARPKELKLRAEPLDELLQEAVQITRDRVERRQHSIAHITIEVDAPFISVHVARHEMLLALANLIENACDGFLSGPCCENPTVSLSARKLPRDMVRIIVSDNGPGIEPLTLTMLQEGSPGVSTRKSHGTGFGVAISRKTIERHQGTLSLKSGPDEGTQVTIRIPRQPE